ncbi:MAG: hypothetical protein OER95_04250 [Acidimicrobiia bacterium]|nr:hypothetical protein [Acidimicrobiia bacterium]
MNEISGHHVSTSMRPTDPDERIRVRVTYVPRGYGLALTISEESTPPDAAADGPLSEDLGQAGFAVQADDGYLTVVESGVTTLELRRPDGQSSYLIWDQSEVAWESLRAG